MRCLRRFGGMALLQFPGILFDFGGNVDRTVGGAVQRCFDG